MLVAQWYLTLYDLMDCSLPGSSVHEILQVRILEWVAISLFLEKEMQDTRVQSLGQEDPLGKATTTHSSILTWRIPRIEEPGGLPSMKLQRVGHD